MTTSLVIAALALLASVIALFVNIRLERRLRETQAALATVKAALDQERHATTKSIAAALDQEHQATTESIAAALDQEHQATTESIAAAHRSTVEEVTTLLANLLIQVDTDIAGKVAEAIALLNHHGGSVAGEANHGIMGTPAHGLASTRSPEHAETHSGPTRSRSDQ